MNNNVLNYMILHKLAFTSDVAGALHLTSYQARYYLQQLETLGLLRRTRKQRGVQTKWELTSKL
ncbi:dolichol monophosphate mannose synthase [Salmonella enterica]